MFLSVENKEFLKKLAFLSIPIVAAELVGSSVNLLDSFMIGSLGLNSINGVGFANQIFFLFWLASFGVNSGASIFMGQFWGKGEPKNVRKVLGITVVTNFCVSVVFAILSWAIPEVLVGIYSSEPEVIALGIDYLRVAAASFFIIAITTSVNAALKSCGQTRLPLVTTICALLCNAGLNYLFIFVFDWGVVGAAIATVIARFVELCVQMVLINKLHMPVVGEIRDYFQANLKFIKEFFAKICPVILNEFSWAVGTTSYTIAYQFCGNAAQGAQQIAQSVQSIFWAVGLGVGSGVGIMLANLLGAGETEKAVRYAKKGIIAGIVMTSFMSVILAILSKYVVGIYSVSDDVKELAVILLMVLAVGLPLRVFNFTTIVGILRSGGDTKYCLMLDLVGVWCFGVPMAFIGAKFLGLPIYIVVIMVYSEEIFKFVFSLKRVISKKWANIIV